MCRSIFLLSVLSILLIEKIISFYNPAVLWSMVFLAPLIVLGFIDMFQTRHAIRRNFPVIGNLRYFFELIRPEINQYFVEANTSGTPFNRLERSLVYQRAKGELDTLPFGTQKNVYEVGYEWVTHSIMPVPVDPEKLRVLIGDPKGKPYSASILNVGAMSFGALSRNAVMALNKGARIGGFAHNTGEGGLSPYHLLGGDLIWQIGTSYFGCRTKDGKFSEKAFSEKATLPEVKMIEIKISQGAKPALGGMLPAEKVSREIAAIRGVEAGKTIISPPRHSTFSTPVELLTFIERLRELSGGKPVGFKLCVGKIRELMALCKAMRTSGITPDFITVDGGEGGTGAAPLEFADSVGYPANEGLILVHNALTGFSLRDKVRLISSGKIYSGFGILKHMAMGADLCYSSRGMMLALGCIQALRCNANKCPTGIATQDPSLVNGLVVEQKNIRVANFHRITVKSFSAILGAIGLEKPQQLKPWHLKRRVSFSQVQDYSEIYNFLNDGDLLRENLPKEFERACRTSSAASFAHTEE